MLENEKDTMVTENDTTEANETGSPIVAVAIAGGGLLLSVLGYVGRKIVKRKKYHTVDHGRFTKDT